LKNQTGTGTTPEPTRLVWFGPRTIPQRSIDDLIELNIDVTKVLLEKSEIEIKKNDMTSDLSISSKIKNFFNRKVDSDVNSTNSFAFESSENEENLNLDISDH
jgi:hypothetical protein